MAFCNKWLLKASNSCIYCSKFTAGCKNDNFYANLSKAVDNIKHRTLKISNNNFTVIWEVELIINNLGFHTLASDITIKISLLRGKFINKLFVFLLLRIQLKSCWCIIYGFW
jgi:hypothetical protein